MLSIVGVSKSYGEVEALSAVDLAVPAGTFAAVLGPSGCGKTTLLRCVAGFERVHGGHIDVAGRRVADRAAHTAPHRRRIAVVPQEGALFPHLSVADNVGFGLDAAARRGNRIDEVLGLVGLAGFGRRMPHQLSGGQRQRVAVARALAPRPPLVLLDEPFSALDAALRADLRRDVRQALQADGATALLVTHDQGEALSMADQVAVMRAGTIVQSGPPAVVYREPRDTWVASFVGESVLMKATVEGTTARTPLGMVETTGPVPGPGEVTVFVRPEQIDLDVDPSGIAATVIRQDYFGHDALVTLGLDDGTEVIARVHHRAMVRAGDRVRLSVRGPARVFHTAP